MRLEKLDNNAVVDWRIEKLKDHISSLRDGATVVLQIRKVDMNEVDHFQVSLMCTL